MASQVPSADGAADATGSDNKSPSHTQDSNESPPDSILKLYETLQWLQAQIQHCQVQLKLHTDPSTNSPDDNDNIKKRIAELETELQDVSIKQSIRILVNKSMQLGNMTLSTLFPKDGNGEDGTETAQLKRDLMPLMDESTQLVAEIVTASKDVGEKRRMLQTLRQTNNELRVGNRKLMSELEQCKTTRQTEASQANDDQHLERTQIKYETLVEKIDVAQHILSAMIVGSGLDWAKTPELKELVLNLDRSPADLIQ